MVNEQDAELPRLSAAVQVTVVVPGGKMEPEGGVQMRLVIVAPQPLVTVGIL